jgi:predicted metal-dependent HD superfamily phosphohydrolase
MPPQTRSVLEARWAQLLGGLGVAPAESGRTFADLAGRYESPGRYYHTLDHLHAMFQTLGGLGAEAVRGPALELAVWFHDAVYDSRAHDNEEQSAALSREVLRPLGLPGELLEEVARLILLTKTHEAGPGDAAGRLLLDADLAILGADETAYDAYARAIRREYAWVPEEAYRTGRRRVLEGFVRRPAIYLTPALAGALEARACRNLARELAALEAPGAGPEMP